MTRNKNAAHACRRGGINNNHEDLLWLKYITISKYDRRALILGVAAVVALFIVPRIIGAVL